MRWFRRFSGPSDEAETVASSQTEIRPSLALSTLFRQLRRDRKYHILELGPPVGQNIEFLGRYPCRIRVEDLYRTLSSFDYVSGSDSVDFEAVFQYLLPFEKDTRFDILMAWDIFNYLEREEFLYLMRHLSRFCHTGSVLYALIATGKHIPDRPAIYRILDENNVECEITTTVLRACPRYHDVDLRQLMPSFRVYNSYLLRNGMKEYLFVSN
ncbi:MAG TPA: hypothetical protein PLP42_05575 [Acidobacteriota bacterium]|nr:hypothetical protein [Acidobacteriota bacterium]